MSEKLLPGRKNTPKAKWLIIAACALAVVGTVVAGISIMDVHRRLEEQEQYILDQYTKSALEREYRFATNESSCIILEYLGDDAVVDIPASYDGYPVTGISESAFKGADELTSVSLPEGVTFIDREAFQECWNLVSVSLPDSLESIGVKAFYNCRELKDITLPDSLVTLRFHAFLNCTSLESITIPSGVTVIEPETFNGCSSLREITLHDGITTVGEGAFSGCTITVHAPHSAEYYGYTPDNGVTWISAE